MKFIFLFSGENPAMAEGEVKAVARAYNAEVEVVERVANIAVCDINENFDIGVLERLALTKAIYKFLGSCKADEGEILRFFKKIDLRREHGLSMDESSSFSVRVRKLDDKSFSSLELQGKIGTIIKERTGARVNLESPDALFQCFAARKRFIAGLLLKKIKHNFSEREPKKRLFFHPSTMKPKFARVIVNLTGIREGERFLDPFCGVGGLLIEAGLIGAEVYGIDKDYRMAKACRKNLEHYGIEAKIEHGDARKIEYENFFHAIACDPPYGRSSSTLGEKAEMIYEESLKSMYNALVKKRYACILAPENINIEEYGKKTGFRINEVFYWRVHKSLIRKIVLFQKD